MIASSVYLNRQIESVKDLHWGPAARISNAFVALDVELSEMANASEWFKVWKSHRGKAQEGLTHKQTLLFEYVDALDFLLLIGNLKNWNHIILNSQSDLKKIKLIKKEDNLDKQYLVMKKMIFDSYFNRSEDAFNHAWRLFLKFGLVDFEFSEEEIEKAFNKKNNVNLGRQKDNY